MHFVPRQATREEFDRGIADYRKQLEAANARCAETEVQLSTQGAELAASRKLAEGLQKLLKASP